MDKLLILISDKRVWLVIVLNLLSAIFIWIMHSWPLTDIARFGLALIALVNALIGSWIIWRIARP